MTRSAHPARWFAVALVAALACVVSCSMAMRSCSKAPATLVVDSRTLLIRMAELRCR